MTSPTVLSLCSGVGVLERVAADLYGASPVAFAEPDPDASAVLAHHWPGVSNFGAAADVPALDADIVTAGWPCQPHAMGGLGLGAADPRAIWPDVRDVIARTAPRLVMLENVAHVCRTGELARVVADLAALGFDAEWTTRRACCDGAPHQRARLFLLAAPHSERSRSPTRRLPPPRPDRAAGEERAVNAYWSDTARRAGDVARLGRWGAYAPAIALWECLIGREAPAPRLAGRRQGPFWAWLMGMPAGWLDVVGRHPAMIRLAGNSIVEQTARAAFVELADRLG